MGDINKLISRMVYWCDEANLGYDQSNRWDIRVGGECDCSSLVYWVLWEAGFLTKPSGNLYSHTLYTGSLQRDLLAAGFTKLPNNGNPQPGDVLLNDTHHVALCTGPGIISQASIDENGNATGGASGDQSDRETNTRTYYNYPWNNYYRPPSGGGSSSGGSSSGTDLDTIARRVIAGDYGNDPQRSQRLKADGYDPAAVQKRVNEILGGGSSSGGSSSGTDLDTIARRVIAGDYGNDPQRSERLKADGYDPAAVQRRVNEILGGGSSSGGSSSGTVSAGTYRIVVDSLNIRTAPSASATITGTYSRRQTVILDGWSTVSGGYVWGRYISAASGSYRYIAVRTTGGTDYAVRA